LGGSPRSRHPKHVRSQEPSQDCPVPAAPSWCGWRHRTAAGRSRSRREDMAFHAHPPPHPAGIEVGPRSCRSASTHTWPISAIRYSSRDRSMRSRERCCAPRITPASGARTCIQGSGGASPGHLADLSLDIPRLIRAVFSRANLVLRQLVLIGVYFAAGEPVAGAERVEIRISGVLDLRGMKLDPSRSSF